MMPSKCVTIGAFAWLLILLSWQAIAEVAPIPPNAKSRTVVVFGDSITEGGTLPKDQRDQMWLRVVERESKGRLKMVNEGKGGRPTKSLPEFEAMLARQPRADVLVIALGTNDSRDITGECVPKAVANIRMMIERARKAYAADTLILLVGPPNIHKAALGPTKPIGEQRETKLRELGDAFAALAKELGCEFVSLFGVIPETSLTKDGVHPDASGHAAIARVIREKLLR
jgi:acyl-CoA thioesterase I